MKKLLFSALVAVSIVSSAFASDVTKVNYRVLSAFKDEYRSAVNVEWVMKHDYVKASFLQDNKMIEVFYKHDGERIGSSCGVTIDQLPTAAKRAFAKKYAAYTIKEAIEFENDNETAYFVTAVSENESLILEIKAGQVSLYKRLK